jgi:hypothetical protein
MREGSSGWLAPIHPCQPARGPQGGGALRPPGDPRVSSILHGTLICGLRAIPNSPRVAAEAYWTKQNRRACMTTRSDPGLRKEIDQEVELQIKDVEQMPAREAEDSGAGDGRPATESVDRCFSRRQRSAERARQSGQLDRDAEGRIALLRRQLGESYVSPRRHQHRASGRSDPERRDLHLRGRTSSTSGR